MVKPITRDEFFNRPGAIMAGQYILQAVWDYGAARCAVLHGMFSGFVLAEQAVEKLFKAYLYAASPDGQIRRFGHDMGRLADAVTHVYPALSLKKHEWVYLRLQDYFDGKYPDARTKGMGPRRTTELQAVDELAISLFVQIPFEEPFNRSLGIFPILYPHPDNPGVVLPAYDWIAKNNLAFHRFRVMVVENKSWPDYLRSIGVLPQERSPEK